MRGPKAARRAAANPFAPHTRPVGGRCTSCTQPNPRSWNGSRPSTITLHRTPLTPFCTLLRHPCPSPRCTSGLWRGRRGLRDRHQGRRPRCAPRKEGRHRQGQEGHWQGPVWQVSGSPGRANGRARVSSPQRSARCPQFPGVRAEGRGREQRGRHPKTSLPAIDPRMAGMAGPMRSQWAGCLTGGKGPPLGPAV
jgi:hypothetical protein